MSVEGALMMSEKAPIVREIPSFVKGAHFLGDPLVQILNNLLPPRMLGMMKNPILMVPHFPRHVP